MKFINAFFLVTIFLSLLSCGGEDDICTAGEATPRMKVKFKSTEGKLKTMDTLYVDVEYSSGVQSTVFTGSKVDSVLIPLRVDNQPFTNVYFRNRKNGNKSLVKVQYTPGSKYVSPACGLKRLYMDFSPELVNPNPVLGIEKNQPEIVDESKTHLYLTF